MIDLASVRDGETPSDTFKNTVSLAQKTEALGYTRFWLAEHHNKDGIASSATSVLIGHVACKTSKIRVGSGGILLPNHAPMLIADQFGTLQSIYPGRIKLDLGRAPGSDQTTMRAIRRGLNSPEMSELVKELMFFFAPAVPWQAVVATPGAGAKSQLLEMAKSTDADELMITTGLYDHVKRERSFEIISQALTA